MPTPLVPNKAQMALLANYPYVDELALPEDVTLVDDEVRNGNCGSGLFRFLWIEFHEGDNAYRSVQRAIEDLSGMLMAMPENNVDGDPEPSAAVPGMG